MKSSNKILSFHILYIKIEGEMAMQEEPRTSFIVNFIVRAVLGMGLIFFINQYLEYKGISLSVGLNGISFLTSGLLGIPGVAMLYGILAYKIL